MDKDVQDLSIQTMTELVPNKYLIHLKDKYLVKIKENLKDSNYFMDDLKFFHLMVENRFKMEPSKYEKLLLNFIKEKLLFIWKTMVKRRV